MGEWKQRKTAVTIGPASQRCEHQQGGVGSWQPGTLNLKYGPHRAASRQRRKLHTDAASPHEEARRRAILNEGKPTSPQLPVRCRPSA